MRRHIDLFVWLASVCLLASPLQAQSLSTTSEMLQINNPSFRKLVVAVPDFESSAGADKQITEYIKQVKEEFPFLLQFTGFFKLIDSKAFGDKKEDQKTDEFQFWKMLGVDTVVKGKFTKTAKLTKLELTGLNIYRLGNLDKKIYVVNSGNELNRALKHYIDYLLESYTGKPGIFSSKIVFAGKKNKNSNREIYTCDPDGSNVEQITKNGAIHISPSWEPSGTKLVYTSYESGKPNIYLYDLKSKSQMQFPGLTTSRNIMNSGGKFAPQSKVLVYTQITEGTNLKPGSSDIYLAVPQKGLKPNAGGIKKEFIKGNGIDVDPVFSPDGKWLVYVSGRYGNPHLFRTELVWNDDFTDVKIKSEKRLTFAGWWNAMPSWSPDSQKIAFAGFDRDINRFDIFMMNNDGTKLERLTLQSGDNKSPSFSPNGHLIIFHSSRVGTASDRGRNQLYIMNQDGTEQRIIPTGLYDAEDPKWGPFMSQEDHGSKLIQAS